LTSASTRGLKRESSIYCDELVSLPKAKLTNDIGSLGQVKLLELAQALAVALDLLDEPIPY
jgi:mRNA-degrading endonuclease toxin of MazEF toxin-antitoxin module